MRLRTQLGPRQIEFAGKVAVEWRRAALERKRLHNNGLVCDEDHSVHLNVLGARTEMAAWTCFSPRIKWHYEVLDRPELFPDLGDFIEVKGSMRPEPTLIVPPKDNEKPPLEWAYLLVSAADHPFYDLLGWLWGHEFLDDDHWNDTLLKARPAWRAVPPYREPEELLSLVRER